MGNKNEKSRQDYDVDQDGTGTLRAIARGRVYVIIRYPYVVESIEDTQFTDDYFRELLLDLQKKLPEFEITLDAGRVDRFCEHVTFYTSSDEKKFVSRPRVLVEVFYTGYWGKIDRDMVKKAVATNLDPNQQCQVDVRCEMGRYHTTPHLETLLRV